MLCDGTGRAAGLETAMEWYCRAAELGEAMGDYNMGWHLEQAGSCSRRMPITAKLPMGMTTAPGGRWGRFYENGVVVAQDGKRSRAAAAKLARNWQCECKWRLARCALGIGGRRAKKAGLDLCCFRALNWQRRAAKEDYGYEAEMNLCGVPLRKTNHKGRKRDASGAMSLS